MYSYKDKTKRITFKKIVIAIMFLQRKVIKYLGPCVLEDFYNSECLKEEEEILQKPQILKKS